MISSAFRIRFFLEKILSMESPFLKFLTASSCHLRALENVSMSKNWPTITVSFVQESTDLSDTLAHFWDTIWFSNRPGFSHRIFRPHFQWGCGSDGRDAVLSAHGHRSVRATQGRHPGVTRPDGSQHWFYQRLSSQWCCKVSVQRLHGQFMLLFLKVIVAFTRITRITSHDFWIFWWIRTGSSQLKFRGSPIPERRFSGPLRSFNSILHACARRRWAGWAGWAGKRSHVWQIFGGQNQRIWGKIDENWVMEFWL